MADKKLLAEIVINGQVYSDWTTVRVDLDYTYLSRVATFTCAEKSDKNSAWKALQIKPSDSCQVYLGGELVMTGYVFKRQAAYDANSHGVQIIAGSRTADLTTSSVPMKELQYRKYPMEAIAKKVLKPFGLQFKVKNPPKGFEKKFRDVSAFPGESVFSFLERLARIRTIFLHDDAEGNVVAELMKEESAVAQLEEGRNILSASCIFDDEKMFTVQSMHGQTQGTDERNQDRARAMRAEVEGGSKRHRPRVMIAEDQVDDGEDLKRRVAHERNIIYGQIMDATVTVPGWRRDDGALWEFGKVVSIYSPMLLLDHDNELAIRAIAFEQSNEGGTTTTLSLCRKEYLSNMEALGSSGAQSAVPPEPSKAPEVKSY